MWCCKDILTKQVGLILRKILASYNYNTHRMCSTTVNLGRCNARSRSCNLPDQTLIWYNDTINTCEIMAGKTVAAERRGYEIVSTEGPFAATLTGHQRMTCGIHLIETNEGLLLAPVRNKTSKFAQDSMLNKTTTELASLAFIEKYLEDLIVKQFTHNWLSICHIQRSSILYLTNAECNTTHTSRTHTFRKTSHHCKTFW